MNDIKMDVQRMVKRRKDSGFTLIELMIVIAVIGILAIVLVPKVGTIKSQAKSAGIDTNMRTVEGYIQSRITSWVDSGRTGAQVADDIQEQFDDIATNNASEAMKNPFTGSTTVTDVGTAPTNGAAALYVLNTVTGTDPGDDSDLKGVIVVAPVETSNKITSVKVHSHDNLGNTLADKTIEIKP